MMTHTAIQSRKMSSSIVVRKRVHVLVALVLILLLDSCTSNPLTSTSHHLFKRDKQKYCGDKLTATLNMVCGGSYNSKRSDDDNTNMEEDQTAEMLNEDRFPLYPAARFNYLRISNPEEGFRRTRRTIISECCLQPCSFNTLRLYCSSS